MGVALTEVAAALPMALSVALAGGISSLRESRRRNVLNEAMHELRRPLQTLSLSLPDDPSRAQAAASSLRMAAAALEQLDQEINGVSEVGSRQPVELGPLLRGAVERWEARAEKDERPLRLHGVGVSDAVVLGDEIQLAQALDNLISNAIEHGSGMVMVKVGELPGRARVVVLDRSPRRGEGRMLHPPLRAQFSERRRHGHGLRVVERVARAHGGTFHLRRSAAQTEARLELPLHRPEVSA